MTLCYAIHEGFAYSRRVEPGTQPPRLTLQLGRGTCRDFALLMMEAVRTLGLAARFVTGYVYVPDRDGADPCSAAARRMPGARSTCPAPAGSSSIPTNGIVGNHDLIRVAVARDPRQAVPLSGSYRGRATDFAGMSVQVNVTTETAEARHAAGVTGAGTSPARRRCPAIASLRSQEGPPEKCAYVPDTSCLRVPAADADAPRAQHPSVPPGRPPDRAAADLHARRSKRATTSTASATSAPASSRRPE